MTATRSLSAAVQHFGRTLAARELVDLPDAELVGRFAERRDEAAFTVLVRRYGTVVLGVCRRVLRHEQDTEDAFQAAFLVLARNAASLQRTGAIGNWLYGVAYNVARKAKAMRHRREVKEREAAARQCVATPASVPDDLREILDGELHALPAKYRTPIVLCDLRGLTVRAAAAAVGCPEKTLGTRLRRGRSLLARRLTRRGVAIAAGALTAALAPTATAAATPLLIDSTVHAATAFAAGSTAAVAPTVAALTKGVSNLMLTKFLKYGVLLACGVVVLAGVSAGSYAGYVADPSGQANGPVVFAANASPAPAAQAGGQDAVAAPLHAYQPSAPGHMAHLHNVFKSILAPAIGFWQSRFTAADDKKDKKEDKDKPALSGTWAMKGGEQKIEFTDKKTLTLFAHNEALVVTCDYTVEKDGLVKAKITALGGKEELLEKAKDKVPVGLEFHFTWKVKGAAARLDDVKGDNTALLKIHLEGDYESKK